MLQGLMQDWPLTLDKVLDFAAVTHGGREILTRTETGLARTTYAALRERAKQVSHGLLELGVRPGDRIATLAWNTAEHMETWYGTYGVGGVVHTLNPRLTPEQIAWIANHAEDKLLFADVSLLPLVERIRPHLQTVERLIVLSAPEGARFENLPGAIGYRDFVAERPVHTPWGGFPEEAAAGLCYTSGTTGNPKGVLYSHRANILHALAANQGDAFGLCARSCRCSTPTPGRSPPSAPWRAPRW